MALLLHLVQMAVILFLTVSLQLVVVEGVVLTPLRLAHQHQPQAVLEVAVFGQVQRAVRHLHQGKALLVALAQALLTIPVVAVAALLLLVVTPQTQAQELAVMAEQGQPLAYLVWLQLMLVVVVVAVINMAQPPVLVVQEVEALVRLVAIHTHHPVSMALLILEAVVVAGQTYNRVLLAVVVRVS